MEEKKYKNKSSANYGKVTWILTCPNGLLDNTMMSAGFSIAAMTRAASNSFSHIFFRFKIGAPREIKRFKFEWRHTGKAQYRMIYTTPNCAVSCFIDKNMRLKKD